MFRKIKLCLIAFFITNVSFSQLDTSSPVKKGKHKAFIKLIEKGVTMKKLKGYPIALNDSGLWMTKDFYPKRKSASKLNYELIFIDARNIDRIYFRRKGRIGWWVLTGAIAGMFIGGAIASGPLENPRKPLDNIQVIAGVFAGLEGGAVIGGFTGGRFRKRFNVIGDLKKFSRLKNNMARYLPGHIKR